MDLGPVIPDAISGLCRCHLGIIGVIRLYGASQLHFMQWDTAAVGEAIIKCHLHQYCNNIDRYDALVTRKLVSCISENKLFG